MHQVHVRLAVFGDVFHLFNLVVDLINHSVNLDGVQGKQAKIVAEDVDVRLVVCLRLIQQLDLKLFFAFIRNWNSVKSGNLMRIIVKPVLNSR